MNRYRVGFSRTADAQVSTIEGWWRENRRAAPDMFLRDLEAAVRLLETSPLIGKAYPEAPVPEVRRLLIGRSRYQVYWEVDAAFLTPSRFSQCGTRVVAADHCSSRLLPGRRLPRILLREAGPR